MPVAGSQCILCDLPVRYDTYVGCTHNCSYCFVKRNNTLNVRMGEGTKGLIDFIKGKRSKTTNFIDWNIPIHFGGMSDPFQPCEKKYKRSLEALKVFAETGYPVVISTKGRLCVEEPYISLIEKCNVVMQISALCEKYDVLEKGAPRFSERLEIIRRLAKSKRVLVRCQPYIHDVFNDVFDNIKIFAECGAFGCIFEGMKFGKSKPGLVKRGADYAIPKDVLQLDFSKLKAECHRNGLKFYSGESCLRCMGDSLTCCGIDGLDGFLPNKYNLSHILNGDNVSPTEKMLEVGTAACFQALYQEVGTYQWIAGKSFKQMMEYEYRNHKKYVEEILKGEKR